MTKLTEEQVHEICKLLRDGISGVEVAKRFNISKSHTSSIRCGHSYKEIAELYGLTKKQYHSEKLTERQVHKVCKLLIKNHKLQDIANIVGCTKGMVSNIRRGLSYPEITCKYVLTTRQYGTLSDDIVMYICELMVDGVDDKEIYRRLQQNCIDVNMCQIRSIRNKKCYNKITSNYNIPRSSFYINASQVEDICELLCKGYSNNKISETLGVSYGTIDRVRKGKILPEITIKYNIPKQASKHLTDEQVHEICKLLKSGKNAMEVSIITGVGYLRVYNIYNGKYYKEISSQYNLYY